jgi:hypothetical protein
MSAHNGLRVDDHESLFPFRPQPPYRNPEKPIKVTELWPPIASLQGDELLAQNQILQKEITTRTQEALKRSEQEPQQAEHDKVYTRWTPWSSSLKLLNSHQIRLLGRNSAKDPTQAA